MNEQKIISDLREYLIREMLRSDKPSPSALGILDKLTELEQKYCKEKPQDEGSNKTKSYLYKRIRNGVLEVSYDLINWTTYYYKKPQAEGTNININKGEKWVCLH